MELKELLNITAATAVDALPEAQLKELQTALSVAGYPIGAADGMFGPKTRNAWAEFKVDSGAGQPDQIGPSSVKALQAKLQHPDTADFTTKEGAIAAITAACQHQGIGLETQIAYVIATTDHESAHTFQPVREAFWLSEEWRKNNLRYYPYYGRGYVQLTWKNNYEKYGQLLGIDLAGNPDLAMEPKNALFILVHGFKTGAFTGRKISDYVNATHTDYFNARRCINGVDRAQDIADLAQRYRTTL